MIRSRICSFLFVLFVLVFGVVGQDMFGTLKVTDSDGNSVEVGANDFGGTDISKEQNLVVTYDGATVSYPQGGEYVLSEFGKMVEASFTADTNLKDFVLGNLKFDIKAGSEVVFKDGEISITDSGKMISKDDIDFVNDGDSWDGNSIKLSGKGVDFMGLSEVNLDSDGYFLRDAQGVTFDDFEVHSRGKVYFLSDSQGEPDLTVDGAYVSVDSARGKFSIGSNVFRDSVSVKPTSENSYGLQHDVGTDHISFRSVGGVESSYLTVTGRVNEGLVPNVDTVGFFSIDDDEKSVYMGIDNNIYTTYNNNVIDSFSSGPTMSPVEINFHAFDGESLNPLSGYDGSLVYGNRGTVGYGTDPTWTYTGSKYQDSELRHGASNLISYNYYEGGKDTIEKIFGLSITGERTDILNNPYDGKFLMDILFQTPKDYRQYIREINLINGWGDSTLGMAHTTGLVQFAVPGGWSTRTIAHEFAHIFEFNLDNAYWESIGGDFLPNLYGAYTDSRGEKVATFVEMQYNPLDSYWHANYDGNIAVQKQVSASILGRGISFYNGRRILEAIGAGPITNLGDVQKVLDK